MIPTSPAVDRLVTLARQYIHALGVPPRIANAVLDAAYYDVYLDTSRLTPEEHNAFRQADARVRAVQGWLVSLYHDTPAPAPLEEAPDAWEWVPPHERDAMRAAVADIKEQEPGNRGERGSLWQHATRTAPTVREEAHRLHALQRKALVEGDAMHARVRALVEEAGGVYLDPTQWLAVQTGTADRSALLSLWQGCTLLVGEEADREREQLVKELSDQKAENARLRDWQRTGLPAMTRYSLVMLDSITAGPNVFAEQIELWEQHNRTATLEATPETRRGMRELSEMLQSVQRSVRPMGWNLSAPQRRGLHGVMVLYSASGMRDDSYQAQSVREDLPTLYQLAGFQKVNGRRSPKRREQLRDALLSLTTHEVPIFSTIRKPNGRMAVTVEHTPLLKRRPVWDDLSEEETAAMLAREESEWPEPSYWVLEIPAIIRQGLDSYFRELPTDLFDRLERASDGQHTNNAADLLMKLYQIHGASGPRSDLSLTTLGDAIPAVRTHLRNRKHSHAVEVCNAAAALLHRAGFLQSPGTWRRGKNGDRVLVVERAPGDFPAHRPARLPQGTLSGAQGTLSGAESTLSGAQGTLSGAPVRGKSRRRKGL